MDNKPHGRQKKVGTGSAGVAKGRKVETGGRPVGGSSQSGRPSGGGAPTPRQGGYSEPQRSGSGKTVGALGLLALFMIIPKKYRAIVIIAILAIVLFSCVGGGLGGQTSLPVATQAPTYTMLPESEQLQSVNDADMMFSSSDLSDLFGAYGLFGPSGSSYSGSQPTGSSSGVGSGGLLQGLPGVDLSTPKPTATPKPQATPKPAATQKPKATPKPAATPKPVQANVREKRVTPIGGGRDTVTLMIYMCGTDLESKYGMGTSDLSEMVKASLSDQVNVIVLTGGCRQWKNSVVSNSVNQVYRVHSGGLERLEDNFGKGSMVDPSTLTKFIQYCDRNFPANRNFLILWDHGGGSISGYGYDEKVGSRSTMTLPQIDKALGDAGVTFDWIGYDACLMSTLETALVCTKYADYLIASEEVEPGTGWYYTEWLNALSRNTSIPTETLGKSIIDSYVSACRSKSYSAQVTLAMTDLAALESSLPQVFRDFSVSTNELIASNEYKTVSNARAGARQFAQSTRINQVDLTDLALRIGTDEAKALAETIQRCVKYNGTTISRCYGLSIYFPYESLNSVTNAVNTYDSLGLDEEYTKVIKSFASLGYGGQVGSSASQGSYGGYGSWDSIFGGSTGGSSGGYSGGSSSGGYYDLLEALLNASYGGSSYGSSGYGSSPYGSSSPSGSLSGAYPNSSAGYSINATDLFGLLSAFSGRSMPADRSWVDAELIADQAENIASNFLDPGRIQVSYRNGRPVLSLTPEEWALVQTVELNVFVDDGEGYIDLGLDNVFSFEDDCLLLDYDGTWLTMDGQVIAYYLVSDTENDDGSWTTIGRIPALLNGEFVNLQLVFDPESPDGVITGAYPLYVGGETETVAKGLIPLQAGDTLEFLCDYYAYDGSYQASHTLGTLMTFSGEPVIENLILDVDGVVPSYRITDIYGNTYWLSF